jgi:hypothetical protein
MREYGHSMSPADQEDTPLGSFLGGFKYHFRWASATTRLARLDVFADRVVVRPRSGRRAIFVPTWEARYTELQSVQVPWRPPLAFPGIRFRRTDNDAITFWPAGEFLQDGAQVLTVLRSAGVNIA